MCSVFPVSHGCHWHACRRHYCDQCMVEEKSYCETVWACVRKKYRQAVLLRNLDDDNPFGEANLQDREDHSEDFGAFPVSGQEDQHLFETCQLQKSCPKHRGNHVHLQSNQILLQWKIHCRSSGQLQDTHSWIRDVSRHRAPWCSGRMFRTVQCDCRSSPHVLGVLSRPTSCCSTGMALGALYNWSSSNIRHRQMNRWKQVIWSKDNFQYFSFHSLFNSASFTELMQAGLGLLNKKQLWDK